MNDIMKTEKVYLSTSWEKLIVVTIPIFSLYALMRYDGYISLFSFYLVLFSIILIYFYLIKKCVIDDNSILYINFLFFKFQRIFYNDISKVFVKETQYSYFLEILMLNNQIKKINISFLDSVSRKLLFEKLKQKNISVEFNIHTFFSKTYYSYYLIYFILSISYYTVIYILDYFQILISFIEIDYVLLTIFLLCVIFSIKYVKVNKNNITVFDIGKLVYMKRTFNIENIESFWYYSASYRIFLVIRLKSGKEYKYFGQRYWNGLNEEVVEKLNSLGISSGISPNILELSKIKDTFKDKKRFW